MDSMQLSFVFLKEKLNGFPVFKKGAKMENDRIIAYFDFVGFFDKVGFCRFFSILLAIAMAILDQSIGELA